MNRVKGKVEAYVVSTMEDNQRTSLLDNLAISVEKIEAEAENYAKARQGRIINDGNVLGDFCESLLAILNHELKILNSKEKPSFWNIAEKISLKDSIQMIYRLDIVQSDSTRCQSWVRHTLKEATIGSFLVILSEDSRLLKEYYKPAAFVRDTEKMESAISLISHTMSSIHFNISIDKFTNKQHDDLKINPELPQEISYRTASTCSVDTSSGWRQRKKTRGNSVNIVNIEEVVTNGDIHQHPSERPSNKDTINSKSVDTPNEKLIVTNKHDFNKIVVLNENCSNEDVLELSSETLKQHDPNDSINSVFKERINIKVKEIENLDDESLIQTLKESQPEDLNAFDNSCTENIEAQGIDFVVNPMHQLKISGSLNHSRGSLFQRVPKHDNLDMDNKNAGDDVDDCILGEITLENANVVTKIDRHRLSKILDVIAISDNTDIGRQGIDNSIIEKNEPTKIDDSKLNDTSVADSVVAEYGDETCKKNTLTGISFNKNSSSQNDSISDTRVNNSSKIDYSDFYHSDEFYKNDVYNQLSSVHSKAQIEGSSELVDILKSPELDVPNRMDDYFVPGIHCRSDIATSQEKVISTNRNIEKPSILVPAKTYADSPTSKTSSIPRSYDGSLSIRKYTPSTNLDSYSSSKYGSSHDGSKLYSDSDTCSDTCSNSDRSFSILADLGITDDFIGIKEDHFSSESFMGFSSHEELENAIAMCKKLIAEAPENSQRKQDLVTQLIRLRLKLHEQKEEKKTDAPKGLKKILGHHFYKPTKISSTLDCDACAGTIFTLLQTIYICHDCGFHCHRKCLKSLDKACVHNRKLTSATYNLTICPQVGLSMQQFRCADCHKRFNLHDGYFEMRLCDYSGQMYCFDCHWNDSMIIPARVIHNWDFKTYKVSRQSKYLLQLLCKKPEINLQKLNPALFNFVDELRDVRILREQIISMKVYLTSCRIAIQEKILLRLQDRQHFVDNDYIYSLEDLIDLNSDILLDELTRKYAEFSKHIKFDCILCHGKGFFCELCGSDDVIFPFDHHVIRCGKCGSSFHRSCFTQKSCPRCERSAKRISCKLTNDSS